IKDFKQAVKKNKIIQKLVEEGVKPTALTPLLEAKNWDFGGLLGVAKSLTINKKFDGNDDLQQAFIKPLEKLYIKAFNEASDEEAKEDVTNRLKSALTEDMFNKIQESFTKSKGLAWFSGKKAEEETPLYKPGQGGGGEENEDDDAFKEKKFNPFEEEETSKESNPIKKVAFWVRRKLSPIPTMEMDELAKKEEKEEANNPPNPLPTP
ncbi:MAG: hypothetical protein WBE18_03085, partial [Gammaproteobacteria bacterium]